MHRYRWLNSIEVWPTFVFLFAHMVQLELQHIALHWARETGQPAPLHTIKVLKQLRHLGAPLVLQQLVYLFTAGTTYDFTQETIFL